MHCQCKLMITILALNAFFHSCQIQFITLEEFQQSIKRNKSLCSLHHGPQKLPEWVLQNAKVAIAVNSCPAVRSMFNSKQERNVSTETNRGESHNRKIDIAAIYVSFFIHNHSISCASIT